MKNSNKRAVRGSMLVEQMMAVAVGAILLVIAWRSYSGFMRQDGNTRAVADRLQTYAQIQHQLERDLEARCFWTVPRVDGATKVVIPPHDDPSGPADGPRGAGEITWMVDAGSGQLMRNGRPVGLAVVDGAAFELTREKGVASLALTLKWKPGPAEQAAARPWSRAGRSWPLRTRNPGRAS